MKGIYRIADINIEINSIYEDVHILCKNYSTKETPDFTITTTEADILFEKTKSEQHDIKNHREIVNYTDSYLETLAVYRLIAEKMLDYNTILFHGSAIAVGGKAYLFTAKSGVGKSTHTKLWREYFGNRAIMINDDKPLLKIEDNNVYVCGTPWSGKHKLDDNIILPIKSNLLTIYRHSPF